MDFSLPSHVQPLPHQLFAALEAVIGLKNSPFQKTSVHA
jgi:hypothetical protein